MNFKYISLAFTVSAALLGMSSCIDDSSDYGDTPVPGITVTTPATDGDKLPELNFNLGDECVIVPQINYDGTGTLQYEWSVGTYNGGIKGELSVVSTERDLHHRFEKGGSYYAHLKITDGLTGTVQEYQVNINRTFEQGYMIVSNDKNGIGNLAFIKQLTAEDIEQGIKSITMEHCIERVNDGIKPEYLADVTISRASWPAPFTRVVACYGNASYYLDPNSFMAVSTINHEKLIPGFKGRIVIGDTNPKVYDPVMNRYVTLLAADMMAVEMSDGFHGVSFDKIFFKTYYAYGTQYYNNFFVVRSPLSVFFIDYNKKRHDQSTMTGSDPREGVVPGGAEMFNGNTLVNVFAGLPCHYRYYFETYDRWYDTDVEPCTVITKEDATGKYWSTRFYGFSTNSTNLHLIDRTEIHTTATTALPDAEGAFALSETYKRAYYASNDKVYVMIFGGNNGVDIALPDVSQAVLSYPAGEEITFMTINTNTDELIVATADKSTGRGNVYIYDVADVRTDSPGTAAKAHYPDCADRISNIIWKPRVAN